MPQLGCWFFFFFFVKVRLRKTDGKAQTFVFPIFSLLNAGQCCELLCGAVLSNRSKMNHLCLQMSCSARARLCLCQAGFGSRSLRYFSIFFFFSSLQTVSSVSTNHRENFHLESTGEFLYCCAGTGRLDFGYNRERAVLFHPC